MAAPKIISTPKKIALRVSNVRFVLFIVINLC